MSLDKDYRTDGPGSLAGRLLTWAATGSAFDATDGGFAWRPEGADLRQFEWVLAGGLGPLLQHAVGDGMDRVPAAWRDALASADLCARIRHAGRIETALEVIAACDVQQVPATLLKGISVSEQCYPAEHLRPMSDIDVLVPTAACPAIGRTLLELGYHPVADWRDGVVQHHGAPLCHPRLGTFVELHTALFSESSPLHAGSTFAPERMARLSVASTYHGRSVRRLSPELQLTYAVASWIADITRHRAHPSFLAAAFDAAYLLAASAPALDWDVLLDGLDNEMARASLNVALSYLPRYGVQAAPPAVLAQLAGGRSFVGPIQRRMIHRMLDRQLFGGRPWTHPLPPPVPGRYSVRHQFRKRVLERLRRVV